MYVRQMMYMYVTSITQYRMYRASHNVTLRVYKLHLALLNRGVIPESQGGNAIPLMKLILKTHCPLLYVTWRTSMSL